MNENRAPKTWARSSPSVVGPWETITESKHEMWEWASHPLGLVCRQESKQADTMLQLWPGGVESRLYPVYSGDGGSDSVTTPFYMWNDREVTQLLGEKPVFTSGLPATSTQPCRLTLHFRYTWYSLHFIFSLALLAWRKIWEQVTQGRVQGVMGTLPRAVNHYSLEPSWRHSHKSTSSSSAKKTLTPPFKASCGIVVKRTKQTQLPLLQPLRPKEFLQQTADSEDHWLPHV